MGKLGPDCDAHRLSARWVGLTYQIRSTLIAGSINRMRDGSYTAFGCLTAYGDTVIAEGLTSATARRRVEEWVADQISRIPDQVSSHLISALATSVTSTTRTNRTLSLVSPPPKEK